MREYKVIDSAPSAEKLRMRLKEGELEKYGESFTPDFVYNVINRLPRFSSMRVRLPFHADDYFMLTENSEATNRMRKSS